MKRENIDSLKEFIAAERGTRLDAIDDREVVALFRERWLKFSFGLLLAIASYFLLKLLLGPLGSRGLIGIIVMTTLWLQFRRLQLSGSLRPGPILNVKKQVARKLRLNIEEVSDAAVQEFDRRNALSLLRGLLTLAVVCLAVELLWPSGALEVLILVVFYTTGALAWSSGRTSVPRRTAPPDA